MAAHEGEEPVTRPDWALANPPPAPHRLPDKGPRYVETPPDPNAPDAPFIAEPWNAATAALFIVIVAVWLWRLRGRYRDYPFMMACMPILLTGGIGGTLFHGFRTRSLYFYLDVVPISVLGLTGGVYMALRAWGRDGWWYLLGGGLAYGAFSALFFYVIAPLPVVARLTSDPTAVAVNATYAALAVVILTPLVWVLVKTRFRHAGWVVAGVTSFVIAWFFRFVDSRSGGVLPMGTHWLWHVFGAAATAFLIEFFYRVEGERTGSASPPAGRPDDRSDSL